MSTSPASSSEEKTVENGGEMGALVRAFDWERSLLGPVSEWPQTLKTSVALCLDSRFAILVWWGPRLVKIYNDAYRVILGAKHPRALGAAGREVWPEIWDTIGPLLDEVMESGRPSWADNLYLPLERNGYAEECYFTFSYSPIRDETGAVRGIFTPVVETTEQVVAARRLGTLRDLAAARPGAQRDAASACAVAAGVLSENRYDLPCSLIYLLREDGRAVAAGGSRGFEAAEQAPAEIDLSESRWVALAAVREGRVCEVTLPSPGLDFFSLSPWGDRVVEAIASPLLDSDSRRTIGFLLAGVSPRRRLDAEYRAFFAQLTSFLSASLGEATTHEREMALRAETERERTRMRDLFMQAPAGIAILSGPEHRYTFVNDLYVSITERTSPAELLGLPIRRAFPELEGKELFELLDSVYVTGTSFVGMEMPARLAGWRSGETVEHWFNFVLQATRDGRGQVDGIMVHAVDVSAQVQARKELEAREEEFRTLANSIPQLAWMADPNGDIYWYNTRWYEYTGTTPEQMQRVGWEPFHNPEILPRAKQRYLRSVATGEPFEMVFPLRGADGVERAFLTRALPLRNASGAVQHWFGTNTDIDRQRKTEDALRQSEKLAVVGRLASSISHEINNPLEAVTNLIYLARKTPSESEVGTYLQQAEQELARVAEITNQMLRFHRQQTTAVPTDMVELLHSVLALYRGKMSREGLKLHIDTQAVAPLTCFASEIRQVLANLIGNALDAMPEGGDLRLRVRAATDWRSGRPGLRITVSDTGSGMPPEVQRKIYEAFFTTKHATGTGLGLWISAGIVDKHGGSLHVRSLTQGERAGTTFTLILPY